MKLPANEIIAQQIRAALLEDVGSGDVTAKLIAENLLAEAQIITREPAVICGIAWVNEVFQQLDSTIIINWSVQDGQEISAGQLLAVLKGPARSLLTGERTALNFLQLLSGTATVTKQFVTQLSGTNTKLLDTRKTIPGLRLAQKYAVSCGGGNNHRVGLYDAYLIKENHIAAAGSIIAAVQAAQKSHPDKKIEVEVENLQQLQEALIADAPLIMLDNFTLPQMKEAVALNNNKAELEVSGNINLENIRTIAATGVNYISVGALTKNVRAIDLSMRFL